MRFLFVLLCAFTVAAAEPLTPSRSDWIVFASSDCEECAWLRQECLPELAIRLGHPLPRTLLYDFETDGNYEVLVAVEDALHTTGDGVPVLLAGDRLLYGKETIAAWAAKLTVADLAAPFPEAALPCLAKGTPSLYGEGATTPASPEVTEPATDEAHARLLYFQTPGCAACALTNTRLEHLAKRFPDVTVHRLIADQPETRFLQYAVAKHLGLPANQRLVTPMVVSGSAVVYGKKIGDADLANLLEQAPADPFWQTWDRAQALAEAEAELHSLTRHFTLPAILLGGLIDGINPCAFAVIVFLISYLTLSRSGGRRTAVIFGLLFTLGVFICYFLIGLGLSELIELVQGRRGLIRLVYGGAGGLCLVFAILAVWDTWHGHREGAEAMRFGMPKILHRAAHGLIREQVGKGVLGLGTVLLGMMVSALELVCTGQIYLPALVLMNESGRNLRSLGLLLAYNLAFVVPLVLIVFLGAYGIGSKQLAAWGRRHAALTRALTALLFLALATLLLVLAWRG